MERFTNIIVGGGTAGCLLANRLASDATRRVLLIEAGGTDAWYPWFHVPVGYLYCIGNPRADWMFHTAPCDGLNGRRLKYPRGKVLGGCSSINGMIYMRGQRRDYDGWAAAANDASWAWANVLPLFKRHERHHKGPAAFHGGDGELYVSQQRLRWDLLDAFREGAAELGIPRVDDFNCGSNEGVGYFEVNQRNGWRWNSRSAFLPTAFQWRHNNLVIKTRSLVDALLFSNPRASTQDVSGVRVVGHGNEGISYFLDEHDQRSEVILCAGAIGSPSILLRSGVGPEDDLQQLHRHTTSPTLPAVALSLRGVGKNLQDHLQIRTVFQICGFPTLNTVSRSPMGLLKMGLAYAATRSGPLSMAPSQLGLFTSTPSTEAPFDADGRRYPNVQFHVQPLSLDAFGEPLHAFDAVTVSVCNLNPESRGTVTLRSLDPMAHPTIQANYLSTTADKTTAAESIQLARSIVHDSSFHRHVVREYYPGVETDSGGNSSLVQAAGRIGTTIFHPTSTCKMGLATDDSAVVDPHLRVRGMRRIRIADASIMPSITSGNTNAPSLMIAEMAAIRILQK